MRQCANIPKLLKVVANFNHFTGDLSYNYA